MLTPVWHNDWAHTTISHEFVCHVFVFFLPLTPKTASFPSYFIHLIPSTTISCCCTVSTVVYIFFYLDIWLVCFFILIYNLQNIDTLFRNTKKGPSFAWITRYNQPTSKQKSSERFSLDPANKWIALRCRIGWIKWFALASLPLPEIGWLSLMERVKTNLKKTPTSNKNTQNL